MSEFFRFQAQAAEVLEASLLWLMLFFVAFLLLFQLVVGSCPKSKAFFGHVRNCEGSNCMGFHIKNQHVGVKHLFFSQGFPSFLDW